RKYLFSVLISPGNNKKMMILCFLGRRQFRQEGGPTCLRTSRSGRDSPRGMGEARTEGGAP
ncbi:MAG: hypothetical protein QME69_02675, partial [Candidatus Saccharicenans sp.]|nr:hypothetical protein [Candidatus Saccharicenans sp.]